MVIKVYLSCCGGEKAVEAVAAAVKQAGVEAQVETIEDLAEVAKAGIVATPAIKINDRLMASGRVPRVPDLVGWLTEAAAKQARR